MATPTPYPPAFVALGANLGDREAAILEAVRLLGPSGAARLVRLSSLYESEADGIPGAPRFLNAVAEVAPLLPPRGLLERLKAIEVRMGRSGGHNESREIDLDIVAYGDTVSASPDLVLPHPRYAARAYVLVPLREIAPAFVCPRTGRPIDVLVAALPPTGAPVPVSRRTLVRW